MGILINDDCNKYLYKIKDKYFDLSIVDPPYGLGKRLYSGGKKGGFKSLEKTFKDVIDKDWDKKPDENYFKELFRISKKLIIFGGNYFLDYLGNTDGMIVWDKKNGDNAFSDFEIAWTNFLRTNRIFRLHHFNKDYDKKIHPTQKPIALYEWIILKFAKEDYNILDTHFGSGNSLLVSKNLGLNYLGFEIDKDYYDKAIYRINDEQFYRQLNINLKKVAFIKDKKIIYENTLLYVYEKFFKDISFFEYKKKLLNGNLQLKNMNIVYANKEDKF